MAKDVFSKEEVQYLEAKKLSSTAVTIKDALAHITQEGGYWGSYSYPGWIVLWRG